jgi:hypothetical protein
MFHHPNHRRPVDLLFDNSLATVTSVTEGNLLNQNGAADGELIWH